MLVLLFVFLHSIRETDDRICCNDLSKAIEIKEWIKLSKFPKNMYVNMFGVNILFYFLVLQMLEKQYVLSIFYDVVI